MVKIDNFVRFEYIDESIIDCRLKGLYKMLQDKNYDKLRRIMFETIHMCSYAKEINLDNIDTLNQLTDAMISGLQHLAHGRFDQVHDIIRNLHYTIIP